MAVFYPDGRRFFTFEETEAAYARANEEITQARQEVDEAPQSLNDACKQVDLAVQRQRRMAELSRKARRGEASANELAELDRLESDAAPV